MPVYRRASRGACCCGVLLWLAPGVPAIAETLPGVVSSGWIVMMAPAGTPAAIVNRLAEGFARVAKTPEIAAIFEAEGGAPVGSTPAQFRQVIVTETERWKKLVEKMKAKEKK